jgi:hypothetical protein
MSVIGMEAIREYRGMGDSWPKAIRETITPRQRIGWRIWRVAQAISRIGDKLTGGL